jgi:hypothetical protein
MELAAILLLLSGVIFSRESELVTRSRESDFNIDLSNLSNSAREDDIDT